MDILKIVVYLAALGAAFLLAGTIFEAIRKQIATI